MKPSSVAAVHREICSRAACRHLQTIDFNDPCAACPEGHWGPYQRCVSGVRMGLGLGDVVASVATPIARVLHLGCVDNITGLLRPESACAKRKLAFNKIRF